MQFEQNALASATEPRVVLRDPCYDESPANKGFSVNQRVERSGKNVAGGLRSQNVINPPVE